MKHKTFFLGLVFLSFLSVSLAQDFDFFSLNYLQEKLISDDETERVTALQKLSSLEKEQKKELLEILSHNIDNPDDDVRLRSLIAIENLPFKKSKKILRDYEKARSDKGIKLKGFKFGGTDPVVKRQQENVICYEYKLFYVLSRPSKEGGQATYVTRKQPNKKYDCQKAIQTISFEVNQPWKETFFGAYDPYIFIRNTSAAQSDWLTIYDVRTNEKAQSLPYSEPIYLEDQVLVYWHQEGPATAQTCPKFKEYQQVGLETVIERQMALDLWTMKATPSDQIRCVPR